MQPNRLHFFFTVAIIASAPGFNFEFTWVKSLPSRSFPLDIFACLHLRTQAPHSVFTLILATPKADRFLIMSSGNTCTTVKNQWAYLLSVAESHPESLEAWSPSRFSGYFSVDVTDSCRKEIDTKVSDHLTFLWICTFTFSYDSVFFSTNRTNFSFQETFRALLQLPSSPCSAMFSSIGWDRVEHDQKRNPVSNISYILPS